jgi:RNA polymerase sigma factor (sigma-70 family)
MAVAELVKAEGTGSILQRVETGDGMAEAELCTLVVNGLRILARRLSTAHDAEDIAQDCLLIVLEAARSGGLRHPEKLTAFARSVVRHKCAQRVAQLGRERMRAPEMILNSLHSLDKSPEEGLQLHERVCQAKHAIAGLNTREREILGRFYFAEQGPEEICHAMGLTDTQYRLLKSRAKAKVVAGSPRSIAGKRVQCEAVQYRDTRCA